MLDLLNSPNTFFPLLQQRLANPLPAEIAQNRMTSRARISTQQYMSNNPNFKSSAVLILLFPQNSTIYSALIRRTAYDGKHGGQLSFPGGKVELSDITLENTAIRETHEEVGVRVNYKDILGKLSPLYIPVSNFLVQPFIALHPIHPAWVKDNHEVAEIIEFPLSNLLDESLKDRRRISIGPNRFVDAPCYILNNQVCWGATAMILAEFESLLRGN
jgi:8-oxo-dGTP pyrophosphatase MutT (NUDIX family)